MSSLDPLLAPRSLAVVGVSSRADSLSSRLLANLFQAGFTGAVYPVNPKAAAIRGLPCYPSVAAIPGAVDLALLMVPRDAVAASVAECVDAGARALVVITAGFREGGEAGAAAERAVLERIRAAGVRMLGPNCMGLINTGADVRLDATFSPVAALPGIVAFGSHSGALGVAFLELAREVGLGFSQFVSLGNSADVTVCDLLEHWEHHDGTRVIMLYLEAIEQPRRFLELAGRIARSKPIVVLKSGRTAAGQRAASSHTGAMAAGDTGIDALLRQAGVLRAETLEELFDTARVLAACPPPRGRRLAVLTNAGGPAIAACDAADRAGLRLAELASATREKLRAMLPAEASVGNPVDMLPSATPHNFAQGLELLAADPGVDQVLTITVTPIVVTPAQVAERLAGAERGATPVASVFMTDPSFFRTAGAIAGLPPAFRFPEAAVSALAALTAHGESAARGVPGQPGVPDPALERAKAGHLEAAVSFAALERAGIATAPWRTVQRPEEVLAAAERVGFPVVLKASGPDLIHKSDAGAVAVNLRDSAELEAALLAMRSRLAAAGAEAAEWLVQRFVRGGREVILGVTRDPSIGPLVMVGLGGVAVEAIRDVAFRPAPLTGADAEQMLGELRGAALLGAFRGRPPADRTALVRAIVALGDLAAANPRIAECDVNPLLVLDEGQGCVAVDARIMLDAAPQDGAAELREQRR